jgi:2-C-methyl-D-erythritol 4-phosphate cytidylyltransferase/2-C-methyl-D-erythritol 2,4-cyclodiphosphate synthase
MTRHALILVAAGRGTRAGRDIPKQYYKIAGQALLEHTLKTANNAFNFDEICVVIAENDLFITELVQKLPFEVKTCVGGASRTISVRRGLDSLQNSHIDYVYIHDAARPFLTSALIDALAEALETHQAAVPSLPVIDALKTLDGSSVDRSALQRMQTPQAFHYSAIKAAFDAQPLEESFADDIALAKQAGLSIAFTQGDPRNFKVTYPDDFRAAEHALMTDTYIATGTGFDVHQFDKGDVLWLCGVPIDCGYTLKGHSDADAGLHALTDAIFGALAAGDIGDHFPPSDPQWKGAASDRFLDFAINMIAERGGELQHVDVTLICEKPKVKPHREAMRARIAQICRLPLTRVSVKATTTEKLGFTGRNEGLAAQAAATIKLPAL